jgi:secreted trypsin-like serine protease
MSRLLVPILSVCAVLTLMSVPSWSKTNTKDQLSATINLLTTTKIQKTQLQAGTYKVIANGNEAKFEQDGKIVAQVPCTLKTLSRKSQMDDFQLDRNRLTEIDVSGKTQAIAFGS